MALSTSRKLVIEPSEVHMLINTKVNVKATAYRKKSGDFFKKLTTTKRKYNFKSRKNHFSVASPIESDKGGIATATLSAGEHANTDELTIKAPSSSPGKTYGPKTIVVHIYSMVPKDVTLTKTVQPKKKEEDE